MTGSNLSVHNVTCACLVIAPVPTSSRLGSSDQEKISKVFMPPFCERTSPSLGAKHRKDRPERSFLAFAEKKTRLSSQRERKKPSCFYFSGLDVTTDVWLWPTESMQETEIVLLGKARPGGSIPCATVSRSEETAERDLCCNDWHKHWFLLFGSHGRLCWL